MIGLPGALPWAKPTGSSQTGGNFIARSMNQRYESEIISTLVCPDALGVWNILFNFVALKEYEAPSYMARGQDVRF